MSELGTFLETMPFWAWFVLAGICLVLEISSGTTYFLWPAAAGAIVGVLAIFIPGAWILQLFIFAIITTLLVLFATPVAKKWLSEKGSDRVNLNQRGAQKIGKIVSVDKPFENGHGKVRYGDTLWQAEMANGADVGEGAKVKIIEVRGTVFVVETV